MDINEYAINNYLDEKDRKRLSRILMLSRAESGLSQEKVALELGIAKKTVQNWERGISAPTLLQTIEWFRIMKIPAMPYFLQFMFPEMEGINQNDADEKIRKQLITLVETMPMEGVRQLMYLFYGDHGSSPRSVLNLMTAYLHTPLKDRYINATNVINNYRLASDRNELVSENHIKPNLEILDQAIKQGRESVVKNRDSYTLI